MFLYCFALPLSIVYVGYSTVDIYVYVFCAWNISPPAKEKNLSSKEIKLSD